MKVLLIDDHPLILSALKSVIQGLGDDVSVSGASSAAEARAAGLDALRAIHAVTRTGGRLVYWNLLVPRSRPEALAAEFAVHPERSAELHARDLAFVYGSFHVESVL